jgi:hypothetical protein
VSRGKALTYLYESSVKATYLSCLLRMFDNTMKDRASNAILYETTLTHILFDLRHTDSSPRTLVH